METLSPDLLYHFAMTYLDHKDIVALDRTCKHMRQRLCGSSVRDIWKDLFVRDFTKHLGDKTDFRSDYRSVTERYRVLRSTAAYLEYACIEGYEIIVKKILSDPESYSQVMLDKSIGAACYKGSLDTVKLLVAVGANINGYHGSSLRLALQTKHLHIARYLFEKGVSVDSSVYESEEYMKLLGHVLNVHYVKTTSNL